MRNKLATASLLVALGFGGLAGSWATAKTGRSPFGSAGQVAVFISSAEGEAIGKQVLFVYGFVPVAKKVLPAVVNIASTKIEVLPKVLRRRSSTIPSSASLSTNSRSSFAFRAKRGNTVSARGSL